MPINLIFINKNKIYVMLHVVSYDNATHTHIHIFTRTAQNIAGIYSISIPIYRTFVNVAGIFLCDIEIPYTTRKFLFRENSKNIRAFILFNKY